MIDGKTGIILVCCAVLLHAGGVTRGADLGDLEQPVPLGDALDAPVRRAVKPRPVEEPVAPSAYDAVPLEHESAPAPRHPVYVPLPADAEPEEAWTADVTDEFQEPKAPRRPRETRKVKPEPVKPPEEDLFEPEEEYLMDPFEDPETDMPADVDEDVFDPFEDQEDAFDLFDEEDLMEDLFDDLAPDPAADLFDEEDLFGELYSDEFYDDMLAPDEEPPVQAPFDPFEDPSTDDEDAALEDLLGEETLDDDDDFDFDFDDLFND